MRYCLYKTTNLITGKYYLGVHDTNINRSYLGSGKKLQFAIKKYGRENFKRETLASFEFEHEAFEAEAQMVTLDLVKDRMCYNVALGGRGGAIRRGMKNSNDHNHKIQMRLLGNKNGAGRRTDEARSAISRGRKGIQFSEEHRRNLSLSQIGNKNAVKREDSHVVSV